MIPFLLLLTLPIIPTVQPAHVDRIELNHYSSASGDHVFDQLIFYDWSNQRKRFDVREWRLVRDESMVPRRCRDGWRVVFYDGGIPREVMAKSMQETFTQYDPETLERDALAIDQRLPLFDETNKVEE
jgi:hypothetical protein